MEHPGPSSRGTTFGAFFSSRQNNAVGGPQNNSEGRGPQFPGASINYLVYNDGANDFDPLQACLKSLQFPEMNRRLWEIETAAKGTCEWLLRHKTYTSWASSDLGLLWIKGKPGSGKSTLLRYVLRHALETSKTREGALVLSFFFHGRGNELQKTPLGLFRSLIYHVLDQFPDTLRDLVATFERLREREWHLRELQSYFKSSLLEVLKARPVLLFVDALDECGQENAVRLVEDFESMLQSLSSDNLKPFRICFSCRHYPVLSLDGVFEVCVEEENRQDISTFLRNKLSSFRRRTSSMIPDLITERANGVFLWAGLMADEVLELERNGAGSKQIGSKVWSVPQTLNALYLGLVQQMDSESLKLIQWIRFAMRPLSLGELLWAMLVDADCPHKSLYDCQGEGKYPFDFDSMKRRVQTLSHGLVEVTSDTKVQFIHQSVNDFLVERDLSSLDWPGKWVMPFVDQLAGKAKADLMVGIAHHQLSRTCIRYLAMVEIGRSAHRGRSDLLSEFLLLHYATTLWVEHTKQSEARGVPQDDLLQLFAGPSNTLMEIWVRICRELEQGGYYCPPRRTGLIHVMLRHGLIATSWAILNKADQLGITTDEEDSEGRTPLMLAARFGNGAIVRFLLDKNARLEVADLGGRTPLSWASGIAYHEDTVRLLLSRGADLETTCKSGWTPLMWAISKGNEAIVRLLLDFGANPEKGATAPLVMAIEHRNEDITRLLLDRGAGLEEVDTDGQTPLFKAVENMNEAALRLLLDQGANLEAADSKGRTPLSWAAEHAKEVITPLLLDRGANLEAADAGGRTPLSWAAKSANELTVKLLLDGGANIEAADTGGRTPLWWAVKYANKATVKLLLDRGANLEAVDTWGRTPLSWAVADPYTNKTTTTLLLDRGANLEAADKDGRTPLSWAAGTPYHEETVRLLLSRGADPRVADNRGQTPLTWAIMKDADDIVQLLLDQRTHHEMANIYR